MIKIICWKNKKESFSEDKKMYNKAVKFVEELGGELNEEATEEGSATNQLFVVYDYPLDKLEDAQKKIKEELPEALVDIDSNTELNVYESYNNPPKMTVMVNSL